MTRVGPGAGVQVRFCGRGGGSRRARESASASGGTVQSDPRRGASETGTVPTARVRHKEPMRSLGIGGS
jgi:hypothetical protein